MMAPASPATGSPKRRATNSTSSPRGGPKPMLPTTREGVSETARTTEKNEPIRAAEAAHAPTNQIGAGRAAGRKGSFTRAKMGSVGITSCGLLGEKPRDGILLVAVHVRGATGFRVLGASGGRGAGIRRARGQRNARILYGRGRQRRNTILLGGGTVRLRCSPR